MLHGKHREHLALTLTLAWATSLIITLINPHTTERFVSVVVLVVVNDPYQVRVVLYLSCLWTRSVLPAAPMTGNHTGWAHHKDVRRLAN